MKQATYLKNFEDYSKAYNWMTIKNQANEKAGNKNESFALVPGADDNYSVVDLITAIELGLGYVWAYSGFVNNPWN